MYYNFHKEYTVNHIIIAGLGASGYAALRAIRRNNPEIHVTVVDPKLSHIMHPCGIPYALEGKAVDSKLYENLSAMGNTKILQGRVLGILPDTKSISAEINGTITKIIYDKLILATGNHPRIPDLPGITGLLGHGLFTLSSVEDMHAVRDKMKKSASAIIIGGGAIGLECAVALKSSVQDVAIYEESPSLLSNIVDSDIESVIRTHLSSQGISVNTSCKVTGLKGDRSFSGISTQNGDVSCDMCILATGLIPDLSLVKRADGDLSGIDYNESGIWVDTHLRTSAKDIFAAGDCVSSWSIIDGNPVNSKLATSAYKQGTIAGINASGGNTEYLGTAGTFVTTIGGLEIAGTGYTTKTAGDIGFSPVSGKISCQILPPYMQGNHDILIKIIYDGPSGRILGAQAAGKGAAERINVISTALEFAIPISELERIEMAYCPSISELHDPLIRAVEFARRRGESKKVAKSLTLYN